MTAPVRSDSPGTSRSEVPFGTAVHHGRVTLPVTIAAVGVLIVVVALGVTIALRSTGLTRRRRWAATVLVCGGMALAATGWVLQRFDERSFWPCTVHVDCGDSGPPQD